MSTTTKFHKKKLVVENGKERDLMYSPKRFPSTAAHVNNFMQTHPMKLKPSTNPPTYWAVGSPAAAAKRNREVCDELYWAAIDSGEDAAVAATSNSRSLRRRSSVGISSSSSTRLTSAFTTASSSMNVVTPSPQQQGRGNNINSNNTSTGQQQQQSHLLDHVSSTTALPLSGAPVSASLHNTACDTVRLALRGRAQWEHAQKKRAILAPSLSPSSFSRPKSAASLSVLRLSRPGTAASTVSSSAVFSPSSSSNIVNNGTSGIDSGGATRRERPLSAMSTATIDHFRKRGSSPTSTTTGRRSPAIGSNNNNEGDEDNNSNNNRKIILGDGTTLYQGSDQLFTTTPLTNRWREFDKSFNGAKVSSREIAEFERRQKQNQKFKEMMENMKKQQQQQQQQKRH